MTLEAATAALAGFDPDGATEMQVARLEPVLAQLLGTAAPLVAPYHAAADAAAAEAAAAEYPDEDARARAIAAARLAALGPAGPLDVTLAEAGTRLRNQRRHHNNLGRYVTAEQHAARERDDGSEHASMAVLSAALAALS